MNARIDELERRVAELERLVTDLVCHGMAVVRHPGQLGARGALRESCRRGAAYWRRRRAEQLIGGRQGEAILDALPLEVPAWVDWPPAAPPDTPPPATRAATATGPPAETPRPQVRLPYRDD